MTLEKGKGRRFSWPQIGKTILIVLLAVTVLSGIALASMYQLDPWLSTRRMRALDPEIDMIPLPLPDTNIAMPQGERVEEFGFSFQIPWKQSEKAIRKSYIEISSAKGRTIMFEDPSANPYTSQSIRELAKIIPGLGPEERSSICQMQTLAMGTKTNQVKWWKTHSQNEKAHDLLFLKETIEPGPRGNLYTVNINGLCGFQRGNLLMAPYFATIELFDSSGHHYRIMVRGDARPAPLTQSEVNGIIASIHPVAQH